MAAAGLCPPPCRVAAAQRPPASLTRRADFLLVQGHGRSVRGALMCLAVAFTAPQAPLRVGYTVSRRVGNAVVRNRVRRRLREIVRRGAPLPAAGRDVVWIAFAAAATASAPQLAAEARALLARAARLRPPSPAPSPHV